MGARVCQLEGFGSALLEINPNAGIRCTVHCAMCFSISSLVLSPLFNRFFFLFVSEYSLVTSISFQVESTRYLPLYFNNLFSESND